LACQTKEVITTKMKTIIRLIIVAVIVLGAQSSHASNPHPSVAIRVLDATSFAIYLNQINDQKLKIAIRDEQGNMLYYKLVRNRNSFNRKLNLRELPTGIYSVEIRDDIGTISYPITLEQGVLSVLEDERVATFNPIIRKKSTTVSLVLFSPAKHTHELSIYNAAHELVHDEKVQNTVNFNKKFDFSEAMPGAYNIVINSQGHKYTYMVPIK
jgi:hypothetical protein